MHNGTDVTCVWQEHEGGVQDLRAWDHPVWSHRYLKTWGGRPGGTGPPCVCGGGLWSKTPGFKFCCPTYFILWAQADLSKFWLPHLQNAIKLSTLPWQNLDSNIGLFDTKASPLPLLHWHVVLSHGTIWMVKRSCLWHRVNTYLRPLEKSDTWLEDVRLRMCPLRGARWLSPTAPVTSSQKTKSMGISMKCSENVI